MQLRGGISGSSRLVLIKALLEFVEEEAVESLEAQRGCGSHRGGCNIRDPFLGGDSKLLMMQEKPKFSGGVLRKAGVCVFKMYVMSYSPLCW